jgi:glutamate-5-semialdehyde dehydrogenase
MPSPQEELASVVYQASVAGTKLANSSGEQRQQLLRTIADMAEQYQEAVLEANTLDLVACREMAVPEVVGEWLKLTPDRWGETIGYLRQLSNLPDPLLREPDAHDYRVPLGLVAFVYEGFVQLAMVAVAMALKTANGVLLKGGGETTHTQAVMADLIRRALKQEGLPANLLATAPQGVGIKELLTQDKYIRLLIPYGRPSFVQQLCKQATVSVLPTAIGNCFLYIGPSGSLERARQMILASHLHEPDPILAIEKVILHQAWLEQPDTLWAWLSSLQAEAFMIAGCDRTSSFWRKWSDTALESVPNWSATDLDRTIALKIVDSTNDAIDWINLYSSGHGDCVVTDSLSEAQMLGDRLNSSTISINAIYPFQRGGANTQQVLLGMSSIKTRGAYCHTGVIDLFTFTARKYIYTYRG